MKMKTRLFGLLTIFTILVLVATVLVALVSAQDGSSAPAADQDSKLKFEAATVTSSVQGERTNEPAIYLIRLEDAPLATYRGGIAGLAATNPAARGERRLDAANPASVAYRDYLLGKQAQFKSAMEQSLGRPVEVVYQYFTANNGLAARLTPAEAARVANMPNVIFVQRDIERQLMTDVGPEWIGAPGIWDGTATGGLPGTQGEGIIIGVIDTGINPSNPSFADVGGDGYDHTNPLGAGTYVGVCNPAEPTHDPTFPCNDKLIGAWGYADVNGGDPRDYDSHGSHTASTAGGNVVSATVEGPTLSVTRTIKGVAPHANIIAYAACCTLSALTAAIDQILVDGVNVVNYSIGSPSPSDPWNEFDTVGFLNARDAGIFVATSAGNAGPGDETAGSPGDAPWILTVGATTHNRKNFNALINLTGGATTPPADIEGKSFTAGYGPAEIVYAGDFGDALCAPGAFPPGTWSSEIVICDRGTYGRVEKGQSVLDGGAGGYVLANDAASGDSLNGDAHVLPAVHITYDDGVVLKAWVADGGASHMGEIMGTVLDIDPAYGDIMASFSSRGANRALPDIIIPSVSAPGVDIMAATGVGDPSPPEWGFISGTSMSSPHAAGSAALLMALHPDWSPAEIQSALMTTAWTDVLDDDGVTPATPFAMGSGRVDLTKAGEAGLVLDETTANYEAADPGLGGDPKTLNLASLGNASCLLTCSWTRTVTSTLSVSQEWNASLVLPTGMTGTVTPSNFTLAAGADQELTIEVDVTGLPAGDWVFSELHIDPASGSVPSAHLPIAVVPSTGVLPDLVEIHTRRDAGSQLVEGLEGPEITDLTIEVDGLVEATLVHESLAEDSADDSPYDDLTDGVFFVTTVVPADARRLVAEITASEAPDIDLFVGQDLDSDGEPEESEQVCASTTASFQEYCNVDNPAAGTWWILAQNWAGSGAPSDAVTLAYAVAPQGDAGNMTVEGPATVPPLTPFDVRVFWDEPAIEAGDRWYGAFSVGTDPGNPGSIGSVNVDLIRHEDDVVKDVSQTQLPVGEAVTLTYTVTVQSNVTPEDLTYNLTDTIPSEVTYVPGSASASAGTVNVAGGVLTWTGVMPIPILTYNVTTSDTDPECAAPLANSGAYVDLEAYGLTTDPGISGDTVWYTTDFDGGAFDFFGGDQGEIINFTDDGFAFFDPSTPGSAPWAHQPIPTPDDPNNLMAIFWRDFEIVYDAATNRGVTLANLTSSGVPTAGIIEYDDVEDFPAGSNPTYDFEVVAFYDADDSPGAYEYIFAYDNLTGDVVTGTIGLENIDGTHGVQYAYNDIAVTDGMAVCFDLVEAGFDPVTITFQAVVDAVDLEDTPVTITNTVLHNTDNPGSKEDSASATSYIGYSLIFPITAK